MKVTFRHYLLQDKPNCLAIFDANTPEFFAVNERLDYSQFLDTNPRDYEVCSSGADLIGAFGLLGREAQYRHLNWILLSPKFQGSGVGSMIMKRVVHIAHENNLDHIKIAASHLSAPFFAKYQAVSVFEVNNGWGFGMHRIDMELRLNIERI
jgi:GNAT superfamily N-acetyltransferase